MSDFSPAIVDGKLVRGSVSQLSRFDVREHGGCPRKYWYKYVGKIPDADAVYFKEGKDGHKRLEEHYRGKDVVFLPMDGPALALLPKPSSEVLPESALEKLTCLRIPFQGSMDLVHGSDVYDYKFQSKIRVYPQPTAQLWGYLEELRLRDNSGGRFGFHYIHIEKPPKDPVKALTWKPKARRVSMGPDGPVLDNGKDVFGKHFEPRIVERQWLTYGSLIKEMQDVIAEPDINKVTANREACFAFGPCPYLGICPKNEEHIMGFMDELAAFKKEQAAVTLPDVKAELKALPPDAPPPDAVPTAPSPEPVAAPKKARKEKPAPPVMDPNEVPDSSPAWAPKLAPVPSTLKLEGLRLSLTIGLPNYSSASVSAEMSGGTEEQMTKEIEAIIMRGIKRQSEAFVEASKLTRAALIKELAKIDAVVPK
ncbi:MAG: hypothetical protein IPJ65_38190 [Archangiaceae bacterium]|nr:hypothetical protein [Archangiaceae bacterium]